MDNALKSIKYVRVEAQTQKVQAAEIVVETAVSLTVNSEVWLTFMCTPTDLEAMAVGFLFNEGIIESMDEIASMRLCPAGDNVDVWLHKSAEKPENWRRTSGCTGGVTSVTDGDEQAHPVPQNPINGWTLSQDQIGDLIEALFESQNLYQKSGGVHTSALSDGNRIYISAEDIGRHNTLDKIAGRCLIEKITLPNRVLLTTGRISSEMLQKAARLGVSVLISRTAPSSLSIQMAERQGITLIGYARRTGFRIYTHPQRIALDDEIRRSPGNSSETQNRALIDHTNPKSNQ